MVNNNNKKEVKYKLKGISEININKFKSKHNIIASVDEIEKFDSVL